MNEPISQLIDRYWEQRPDRFGSVEDINQTLTCREGDQFLLTDINGNAGGGNRSGLGLYYRDARHLSAYDLMIDGRYPLVLLSSATSGHSQEQVLGNHRTVTDDAIIGRASIEVRRLRTLGTPVTEQLVFINHNSFAVAVRPAYLLAADFADVFQIRGHQRRVFGELADPTLTADTITYSYHGVDHVERRTSVRFDPPPQAISGRGAAYTLHIPARESMSILLTIDCTHDNERPEPVTRAELRSDYSHWRERFAGARTDNESFNDVLARSLEDLRMLRTETPEGAYFAAGIPWYATLFGRDSLITALQLLPYAPSAAKDCLELLARLQGTTEDRLRDEEPGKILHERREDELSTIGELPYARYYGSVDSTPLFLLLAGEYFHWTDDRATLEGLLPAIDAAVDWLAGCADLMDDGYARYRTDSVGLRNQGWKDSDEGIVDAGGRILDGPIALAEVQGYVYAACRSLGRALTSIDQRTRAAGLERRARDLRSRFFDDFWLRERHLLAMALDGENAPADVMSSNAGQVLWSGILDPAPAGAIVDSLMSNEMFTGWGIRTLASSATSYFPLGYHLGTVWPHDNGIIAQGFKYYGYDNEVCETATALFDAARQFPMGRLPELFGGQPRTAEWPPIPYPVACRPQAWTAGTFFHLLTAMLGLYPDAHKHRLDVVRPQLPEWLEDVYLTDLRVGSGSVDLHFRRHRGKTSFEVLHARGVHVLRGRVEPIRRFR